MRPTVTTVPLRLLFRRTYHGYCGGAASNFDTDADDRNGWDARAKNLDMKIAVGSHDTMFVPAHVKVLTGVVKDVIATVPGVQDAVSLLSCDP